MKNEGEARDSGILSNPLSLIRSGYFAWSNAYLSSRSGGGRDWSLRSADTTSSNYLLFSGTNLLPQYYDPRGNGMAVRCVLIPISPSYTPS